MSILKYQRTWLKKKVPSIKIVLLSVRLWELNVRPGVCLPLGPLMWQPFPACKLTEMAPLLIPTPETLVKFPTCRRHCYGSDGHLGWCNGKQARLASLQEWVQVSLGDSFIQPYVTSKKKKTLVNYKTDSNYFFHFFFLNCSDSFILSSSRVFYLSSSSLVRLFHLHSLVTTYLRSFVRYSVFFLRLFVTTSFFSISFARYNLFSLFVGYCVFFFIPFSFACTTFLLRLFISTYFLRSILRFFFLCLFIRY